MVTLIRTDAHHRRFGQAILWGGLVAGLLEAMDGMIAFGFKAFSPVQVLQYIASGAIGKEAFDGGLGTALLGFGFHFFVAFAVAFAYAFVAERYEGILRRPIPLGLAYGAALSLVMNYLVLPFTAVGASAFEWPYFLNSVVGHAIFVGLPIAFATRKYLDY